MAVAGFSWPSLSLRGNSCPLDPQKTSHDLCYPSIVHTGKLQLFASNGKERYVAVAPDAPRGAVIGLEEVFVGSTSSVKRRPDTVEAVGDCVILQVRIATLRLPLHHLFCHALRSQCRPPQPPPSRPLTRFCTPEHPQVAVSDLHEGRGRALSSRAFNAVRDTVFAAFVRTELNSMPIFDGVHPMTMARLAPLWELEGHGASVRARTSNDHQPCQPCQQRALPTTNAVVASCASLTRRDRSPMEQGETVFAEGDPGDKFYILLQGKVPLRSV